MRLPRRMTQARVACGIALFAAMIALWRPADAADTVRVRIVTELGDIVVEVDSARTPITSTNFLRYVDEGFYNDGRFHRSVKMDNQPQNQVKIEVIQAGIAAERT